MLQVWAQTSTGSVAASELPTKAPERFRVELGLRELVNPGAEGGGVLWVQALSAGVSIALIPGGLGLEVTAPLAVASELNANDGSTNLFLGNPEVLVVGHLTSGVLWSSLSLGLSIPLQDAEAEDAQRLLGVASLGGGALTYQWSTAGRAVFKGEVSLALGSGWLGLRGTTTLPLLDMKPSGDVQLEGGYRLSDTWSIGARAGLARFQVPMLADRIVRICIADEPVLCPEGPAPPRYKLESAVLRFEPFVVVDVGPQLRFSWIFLAASVDPVEQLYGRHEFTASVGMGF